MELALKIIATGVCLLLAWMFSTFGRSSLVWLHDPEHWKWGSIDPIRFLLFDEDGNFRRWGVIVFYAGLIALIWWYPR